MMRRMPRSIAMAVIVLALHGCGAMNPMTWWSGGPEEQASQRYAGAVRYQCSGGKQLAVRYAPQGQSWAMVILPEREFRLDQVPAGSGTRYSNGRTTLITKGDEAMLEEEGSALFTDCRRTAQP